VWTKLNEMMLKHMFPKPNFKGFMAENAKPNGTLSKLFMVSKTPLSRWLIRSALVYSIGIIHLINTQNN
jgi:hypothetical protein